VHMGFFADMDENSDGFITSSEMEAYARSVGMEVTQERVKELIADKDFDKDGE
jgi:Ca2+-binding EF-hand superfamily protein